MKKVLPTLALCAAMTALAACGADADSKPDTADSTGAVSSAETVISSVPEQPERPAMGGNVQIANPFFDFATQQEAEESVGITWGTIPESVGDYTAGIQYRSMPEHQLLELIYQREDDLYCRIRKAPGAEDISGNYSGDVYELNEVCTIGDQQVTLQGNDDLIYLTTWTSDGYSYSLDALGGLSRADTEAAIIALCG